MAGEIPDNVWPLPKFYFSVQPGDGQEVKFQEVSGLESETKVIEYRHSDSPVFKMPGLGSVRNVTLRKGIFANDSELWGWYNQIKMNTISRRTVVINLLDESSAPKMVWTLNNAWPTKITGTDLKSEELAFETLTVSAP